MMYKKFATFNCQGLLNKSKLTNLADDFLHHGLTAMMVQETHIQKSGIQIIESSSKEKLHLYYSGHKTQSTAGTGIILKPDATVSFNPISERILP